MFLCLRVRVCLCVRVRVCVWERESSRPGGRAGHHKRDAWGLGYQSLLGNHTPSLLSSHPFSVSLFFSLFVSHPQISSCSWSTAPLLSLLTSSSPITSLSAVSSTPSQIYLLRCTNWWEVGDRWGQRSATESEETMGRYRATHDVLYLIPFWKNDNNKTHTHAHNAEVAAQLSPSNAGTSRPKKKLISGDFW